jgi:hypothetical protein
VDGTIIIYDVEREDGFFTPLDPNTAPSVPLGNITTQNSTAESTNSQSIPAVEVLHQEWDPLDTIFVTIPPWHPAAASATALSPPSKPGKSEVAKNPVSHWRLSKQAILGGMFHLFPSVKLTIEN